jgi:hypothetical protein
MASAMKAVADLFIARSRAAILWFVVAWTGPILAGAYVQSRIAEVRKAPQFVMAGLPSLHYQTPAFTVETVEQLHSAQTRLALETIYNRGPAGLDHADRRFRLFTDEVNDTINQEIIAPNVIRFRDTRTYQKIEVSRIDVNVQVGQGEANTIGYGQLVRTSVENGEMVNRTFSVKAFFTWESNPNPRDRALYPTICKEVTFFSTIQTFP